MRAQGVETVLASLPAPGALLDWAARQGFKVWVGPSDAPADSADWLLDHLRAKGGAHWLVVDHYRLGADWHRALRPYFDRLLVIDDLADRQFDCDLLVNPNPLPGWAARYQGRVPEQCRLLLGADYLLLREEFLEPGLRRERSGPLCRLLITFGGSDPTGETAPALDALLPVVESGRLMIQVILGASQSDAETVRALCQGVRGVECVQAVNDMARRLRWADAVLGAGGSSSWERCWLGVPSWVIQTAENQLHRSEGGY